MSARKKTAPRLSDADRRFIYQALKRNFSFDEEYPLASLGWCFLREDIDKADYGFIKLKPMLEELGAFVSTSAKEVGGVSQSMFTLHEHAPYDDADADADDAADTADAADAGAVGEDGAPDAKDACADGAADSSEATGRGDAGDAGDAADGAETAGRDVVGDASGKPEGRLSRHPDSRSKIAPKAQNENANEKEPNSVNESSTVKDTKDSNDNKYQKHTVKDKKKGKAAALQGKQESCDAQAADASASSTQARAADQGRDKARRAARPARRGRKVVPGKALERFAHLGSWPEFLSALAALALDEPWDFNGVPGIDDAPRQAKRYDILHNYIRYTFYRLTLEDKVGFSAEEDFAAFNTGLVDKHYEDIYACFEASEPDARHAWAFSGFCTAGTGRFGKRLVRELNPLPQPASYLQRKEDLLFDLDREVVCDVRHIVVDNVHRLPLDFLRDELASSRECRGILAGIDELGEQGRAARFERLRGVISEDTRLFNRLSNSINAAIDQARRQVRWNYKTAVPAYYPRTNSMNLLLPLNLTDSTTPDVALVVELQKSGNYQGQTVITMAQAYRDARLLCRPYIDWLSPASIIDAPDDEEEEE